MNKYIAPRKSIQLTDDIPGDSFLLEDGGWGMSMTAIANTVELTPRAIFALVNANTPKALTCKGFIFSLWVEGSNKSVNLVKSPGVALIWQMVAESDRIAKAKRDRAVSLLASFTADKLEDIHSHAWGKARSYQESLEYRTQTQRHIETALGLYRIWVEFIESNRSATLPKAWTGKPSSKGLPGITLTEDMWKVLSFYKHPYLVKVPGKKYAHTKLRSEVVS